MADPANIIVPMGKTAEGERRFELTGGDEYLAPPLSVGNADLDWFTSTPRSYYAPAYGRISCPSSNILSAKNAFVSTRELCCGVIFDATGAYTYPGFLDLRDDLDSLVRLDGGDYCLRVDPAKLSKIVRGGFVRPFEGNYDNYYHWLIEGLIALFLLREAGFDDPPLLYLKGRRLRPWQRDYLALLGVETYLAVDSETTDFVRVEEVFWLSARESVFLRGEQYRRMAKHLLDRGRVPILDRTTKVYVRRAPNIPRAIANAAEVENLVASANFRIVELETLTVIEQMTLFSNAEAIVAPHGAGLANLIYCRPDALVVELIPEDDLRTFYWHLAAKMGLSYAFVRCKARDGRMRVPVADLMTLLARHG